ncbi:ParM/StbA family protein [Thermicanus aegyptius]|uniref:ParM/StbA family protein n=1 Tax=Thermicanus aegyptius TaxID=94009 RepID=UPI0003F5FB86|nr:ParM/StbA family protein [Thermicanus aegyptius]
MFKIAVDIGYGYVKGINENGERVLFRSLISPAHDRSIMRLFGPDEGENDIHVRVEERGKAEEYFVGDLALESRMAMYAFDRNKINEPETKILLATAVGELLPPDPQPIHLITGLPFGHFKEQKDAFEDMLNKININLKHLTGKKKGQVSTIKFDKVTVFIQGGASVYANLLNTGGFPKRPELFRSGELISAVNIGFRTVDVVTFHAVDKLKLMWDMSFTIDASVGGMQIRTLAQDAFFEKTGHRPNIVIIEDIIKKGGRQYFAGREIDISSDLRKAKETVASTIKRHITSMWGEKKEFVRTIFFCGGGALELKEYLEDFHPNVEFPRDGQFADAIGYLILGRIQEQTRKV